MSLFNGLVRAFQGKPIFTDNPNSQDTFPEMPGSDLQPEPPERAAEGTAPNIEPTVPPVAQISRVNVHPQGNACRVDVSITNTSAEPVDLKRLQFGEYERELEYGLRPGQSMQCTLYQGPLHESPKTEFAQLIYRTETGHYYVSVHDVRYTFDSHNNGYLVDTVRLHPPIRPLK